MTKTVPVTMQQQSMPFTDCDCRTRWKLVQKLDMPVIGGNDWHWLASEMGLNTSEINVRFSLTIAMTMIIFYLTIMYKLKLQSSKV